MPTFNDLYYTDIGNAELKPEYVSQYNIGAVYDFFFTRSAFRTLHLSLDGYHNRITDKIIAVPKGTGQYRWMMMNIGKVRIWGLDFTASTELSLPKGITLNGRLNYTFQRAWTIPTHTTTKTRPQLTGDRLPTYPNTAALLS